MLHHVLQFVSDFAFEATAPPERLGKPNPHSTSDNGHSVNSEHS